MPRSQFGEDNPKAKLTDDLVREIRESPETGAAVAARLGLCPSVVSRVRSGKAWAVAPGKTRPARKRQAIGWTETPSGCWECNTHAPNSDGYPIIKVAGRSQFVHRVVYAREVGPIPDGMLVRHKCHNRLCCRPEHLLLGTDADNVADRVAAGRSARGERNGRAKLTWDDARAIRASREGNWVTAKKYGVDAKVIRNIRQGLTWRESDGKGNCSQSAGAGDIRGAGGACESGGAPSESPRSEGIPG